MPTDAPVWLKATVAKFNKDESFASADLGKTGTRDALLAGKLGGLSHPPTILAEPVASQYTGVGGPLEEVDYPACSRTVTDRCIQLYKRSRTGR